MAKRKTVDPNIELDEVAKILSVHARTVLRYINDDVNVYWAPGHNPTVSLDDVAEGFGEMSAIFTPIIDRVRRGKDAIMKPADIAGYLEVPLRTFRHRKYPPLIHCGSIVRYSRFDTVNYHIENFTKSK